MNELKSHLFLAALETTGGLVQHHLGYSGRNRVKMKISTFKK
ncbi:hypothetical protein J2X69_002090 [Algoriphagus sp. 4150]|nr:hypothetical protein [Algoriphagus sp. 4150]